VKILSKIWEPKTVGRAAVPAIGPVVEATCRSLARVRMAGTAARPTKQFQKNEIVPAQHCVIKQQQI